MPRPAGALSSACNLPLKATAINFSQAVPVALLILGFAIAPAPAADFSHAQKTYVPATKIDRRLDYDSLRATAAGGTTAGSSAPAPSSQPGPSGLVPPPPAIPIPISNSNSTIVPPPPPSPSILAGSSAANSGP